LNGETIETQNCRDSKGKNKQIP